MHDRPTPGGALARLLDQHLTDLLTWLDDYPHDEVDRSAAASIRQSIGWVIDHLPEESRRRLATGTGAVRPPDHDVRRPA
jgi:hypothetical protein